MAKVRITDDAASGRPAAGLDYGAVQLRLRAGGHTVEAVRATYPGSPESPPTPAELEAKFADCAAVYAAQSGGTFGRLDLSRMAADVANDRCSPSGGAPRSGEGVDALGPQIGLQPPPASGHLPLRGRIGA
jgi:hypothetical protein